MKRFWWRGPTRSVLPIVVASALLLSPGGIAVGAAPAAGPPASLDQIRQWNQTGRSREAEQAARAYLKEAGKAHGPESAEVAEILDELAVALRRGGKNAGPEALEVCQRAIRIKETAFGKKDPRYAASLYNLGLLYFNRKEFSRAMSTLEETLEIRKSALGSNHPDVAKSLLALGSVKHALGNFREALMLTERGVAIEEAALGATNPERANGLNALAVLRYAVGDYPGAIPLFEQAIALWERSPTPNQGAIAGCCYNLGAVCDEMGDHARARANLERALRLQQRELGPSSTTVAMTLTALSDAVKGMGDVAGAKDRLMRADRILESVSPLDPDREWVRAKLGWIYLDEGDLNRSAELFRLALRAQDARPGPVHPIRWLCLRGMAMVAAKRGEIEEARKYYEQTVDLVIRTSGPGHPDLGRVLPEYASFLLAEGDSLAALKTALRAAEVNREHSRLTARGTAERQALLYASDLDTGLDVAFAALSGTLHAGSDDHVRQVWDALVRSRALVLDEVAERARIVEGAGEVVEIAKRLEAARGRLANLLVRVPSGESPAAEQALVAQARGEVELEERELGARSASFRRGNDLAAVGLDQVLSALPPEAALLSIASYGTGRGRSYMAFLFGQDRSARAVPLGSADEIDLLIDRWRKLAGTPPAEGPREPARAEAACRAAGRALRARVWDPFSNLLAGSSMVLIVPDGLFNLVNLAALPESDTAYLVEGPFVIHHLSAERDIVRLEELSSTGVGLLALGGASFDMKESPSTSGPAASVTEGGGAAPRGVLASSYRGTLVDCQSFRAVRFEPLPETIAEVDEIAKLWGRPDEVVVLKGVRAGERSVKQLLPGKRVAHFATHGFFLDDRCGIMDGAHGPERRGIGGIGTAAALPVAARAERRAGANPLLLSGLALAGANRRSEAGPDEEDGILIAEEIASLDLSGLDWAVLSACETGVGDVRSGEGVLGLRRAFQVAGAGTLIMSLWPVEDRSARSWMKLLYEGRFQRNLDTAEAVRDASLGVLKSLRAQGHSTHPFYWAAFVATGGWR